MNLGIWTVCRARFCPACDLEMETEYVLRRDGLMRKAVCERCGKETMTAAYRYTMNRRGLEKRGRLDG